MTDFQGCPYVKLNVNIWIYSTPYNFPGPQENPVPQLLNEDTEVYVYDFKSKKEHLWPSLPLLGLRFNLSSQPVAGGQMTEYHLCSMVDDWTSTPGDRSARGGWFRQAVSTGG
jgi:hypothetical protein